MVTMIERAADVDALDDPPPATVVLVFCDSARPVLDLNQTVPGIVGAGVAGRERGGLRNGRHVPSGVIGWVDPGCADGFGDTGDFVGGIRRARLVEIGGASRLVR